MVYDRADIRIGKNFHLSVNCQFFYIYYTGYNDGLFISQRVASSRYNTPFSLCFQVTQAFTCNIEPFPVFKWNLGLA
jgi:hypothetical protein